MTRATVSGLSATSLSAGDRKTGSGCRRSSPGIRKRASTCSSAAMKVSHARALPWDSPPHPVELRDGPGNGSANTLCHPPMVTRNHSRHGALRLPDHVRRNRADARSSVKVGGDLRDFMRHKGRSGTREGASGEPAPERGRTRSGSRTGAVGGSRAAPPPQAADGARRPPEPQALAVGTARACRQPHPQVRTPVAQAGRVQCMSRFKSLECVRHGSQASSATTAPHRPTWRGAEPAGEWRCFAQECKARNADLDPTRRW